MFEKYFPDCKPPMIFAVKAPAEQAERFLGIARDVWDRIPPADQAALLEHWQPEQELRYLPAMHLSVVLETTAGLCERWCQKSGRPQTATVCAEDGRKLIFDVEELFSWDSDETAQAIAEVLAWCLLFSRNPNETAAAHDEERFQLDGDAIVAAWGFCSAAW